MTPDRARGIRFAGYAAIFDRPDSGGDIVRKGAFAAAPVRDVPIFWQHDTGQRIGTIEMLKEDRRGLRVIGRLAGGRAVAPGQGLSFGYRVRAARKGAFRELTDLELIEVSLVAQPMQPLARVHAVENHQEGEDHGL